TEQNVTLDQCSQSCIGDAQCRAFTYNTKAKWCFLKTDYSRLNPFPGAVAGRIVEGTGEPDIGAPATLSFLPDSVPADALRYRTDLLAGAAPDETMGVGLLTAAASSAMLSGNVADAVEQFRAAIRISPDDRDVWSRLAIVLIDGNPGDYTMQSRYRRDAVSAAFNAYLLTRGRTERADALVDLARALDRRDLYRPAIEAYKASLELVNSAATRAALEDLRARKGFRLVKHTVDADTAGPRVCLQSSEEVVKTGVDYASFFSINGAAPRAITTGERQLCIEGLEHGEYYDILMRDGLPSAVGEVVSAPVALNIYVRDRAPTIRFTGENFVLPSTARRGIPLVSINTDAAELSLYRVGDRALAQLLSGYQFLRQLDGWEVSSIEEQLGQAVWKGELAITSELNREVVTSFPVDEALKDR